MQGSVSSLYASCRPSPGNCPRQLKFALLRQSGTAQQLGKAGVTAKAVPCWADFEIHFSAGGFCPGSHFQPLECLLFVSQSGIDKRKSVRGDMLSLRTRGQLIKHLLCFDLMSGAPMNVTEFRYIIWQASVKGDCLIHLCDGFLVSTLDSVNHREVFVRGRKISVNLDSLFELL